MFKPKDLIVRPIPHLIARQVCERRHYLKSYPGAAVLNFGVFVGQRLLGVAVLGLGPTNLPGLFRGAKRHEVLCLARFWLSDDCGRNSESRALATILRHLRRHQDTAKALVAYSDPAVGHSGAIYRAAGFLYLGESDGMPQYRLPDGSLHHSRSLSHAFGTHSTEHFRRHGVALEVVPQRPKLTYVALVDPTWRDRLTRPPIPYPRAKEDGCAGG